MGQMKYIAITFLSIFVSFSAYAGETEAGGITSILKEYQPSFVRIEYKLSAGHEVIIGSQRGFIVRDDGLIAVSGVMRTSGIDLSGINVFFENSENGIAAKFIGKDEETGLAFIQIEKKNIPRGMKIFGFDKDRKLLPGEEVAVAGLLGRNYDYAPFVRAGRVLSFIKSGLGTYITDIPTMAGISPAPLFDSEGKPVGIVTSNEGNLIHGLSFGTFSAITSEVAAKLIESPPVEEVEKNTQHGWLGILMAPLTSELDEHWELGAKGGIVVSQVFDNSPAKAAGMRAGDILTSFDGHKINVTRDGEMHEFVKLVKGTPTGKKISVTVFRDTTANMQNGEEQPQRFEKINMEVTLGERPKSALYERFFEDGISGLILKELSVEDRVSLHLDPSVKGVMVLRVEEGSWAHLAKIEGGDIISKIDNVEVNNLESYRAAFRTALMANEKAILMFICRDGGTVFKVIKPRAE
ncbi:MAG: PDZ domain-containing protein [Planctomycetes bacterium]|nr:PDZ domain-containing protein [Planctomycetota bacterium]